MKAIHAYRAVPAACAAMAAITLIATAALLVDNSVAAANFRFVPTASTADGAVRGVGAAGVDEFLGLPYAAPPTGGLRWRPPQPPSGWKGVRDATRFAASCPELPSPFVPPGTLSEDCLYLSVYTPTLRPGARRP